MFIDKLLHPCCHITLKILFCRVIVITFYPKSLDTSLAGRTPLPFLFGAFVTSDMYIFRREKLHHFRKDSLYKVKCTFLADTKYLVGHTPYRPYCIRASCAAEFRI